MRAIGELEKEQLVVGAEQVVNEPVDGRPSGRHLVRCHAAARVEHEAKADRDPLVAEVDDLLWIAVFENREIFLAKSRREATPAIGHPGGDVDELDTATEAGAVLGLGAQGRRHESEDQREREHSCSHRPFIHAEPRAQTQSPKLRQETCLAGHVEIPANLHVGALARRTPKAEVSPT